MSKTAPKVSRRQSVVTKVGYANGIIFIIGFMVILFATLLLESIMHIQKDVQMMNVYISNTLSSVDNSLKDMGRVSLICFSDIRTQEIMRNHESKEYKEQLGDDQYLSGLFTSLVSIRDDISGIYVMNQEHVIYSQDNMNPSHPRNTTDDEFVANVIAEEKSEGDISGCQLFLGKLPEYLYYSPMYQNNPYKSNCIYLVRPVRSFRPYEVIGHIALTTPIQKIQTIATEYLEPQTNYLFVDHDGTIFCGQNSEVIGQNLQKTDEELYHIILDTENQTNHSLGDLGSLARFDGTLCIVTSLTSEYSNLTLITAKPVGSIALELMPILLIYLVTAVGLGLIVVAVSYNITRRRLHGLSAFSRDMSEFKKNNLSKRYEIEKMDEIGVLQTSFNTMMDYIDELVISEYEDKMKIQQSRLMEQNLSMLYLKSQINPHFLYNTLDMIRIHAALNDDMETADIIMQLVTFYRLSTRVDSPLVSLRTEVEMIEAYMKLMKFRYMSLEFVCQVQEGLDEIEIPNFILQPLVENSLLHGLRNRGYHGCITLTAQRKWEKSDIVYIQIEDDGMGMDEQMLADLNNPEKSQEFESSESQENEQKGHVGIRNVQSRLKIYYGKDGGVQFAHNVKGGITVTILLKDHVTQKLL